MADPYDSPYGAWVEDPSNTGAQIWDPNYYGYGDTETPTVLDPFVVNETYLPGTDSFGFTDWGANYFGGTDPFNPYGFTDPFQLDDGYPTGTYVGSTLTGDMGTNPLGVGFGDTANTIPLNTDPTAVGSSTYDPLANTTPPPDFEALLASRPTYYPGTQYPSLAIGIPGVIGIGAGGLVTGGLLDILGDWGSSGGGGSTTGEVDPNGQTNTTGGLAGGGVYDGGSNVGPVEGDGTTNIGGTLLGGGSPTGPISTVDEVNTGSTILPPPTTQPPVAPTEQPPVTMQTERKDPIVFSPVTSHPTWNEPKNTGSTFIPFTTPTVGVPPTGYTPTGGGGGGNIPNTGPTVSTTLNPLQRNYLGEGELGVTAHQQLLPQIMEQYGTQSGQPGQADAKNFFDLLMGQYGANFYNPELTRIANEQTIASNADLRTANIEDIERLSGRAMAAQRSANPELYGMLGVYSPYAQDRLWRDAEQVNKAGQLSPDEIRMAQQGARQAAGAQGRLRGNNTMAAEVLNREQFRQQREQTARSNLAQSQQAALGGMGMAQAASFNPFDRLLGQGMNTQNVGTNQALFGQGSAFSSGGLSNQFTQQMINPYNPYAADVYGTNVNAANAMQIANSNNSAARAAAEQALLGQALGSLFQTGVSTGWKFGMG